MQCGLCVHCLKMAVTAEKDKKGKNISNLITGLERP
jgi:hypothetical protein